MTPLGASLTPLSGVGDDAFVSALSEQLAGAGQPLPPSSVVAALSSVAAVSPYLRAQMLVDPIALLAILDVSLDETIAHARALPGQAVTALRQAKRRVALAVALADLCGGATVETVTGALSDFAEAAVQRALGELLADFEARGHVMTADPAASGIIILGLGKFGAHELNYSSDIDLVVLYDPVRLKQNGLSGTRVVRLTQRLAQLLTTRTADGYVFRVDLRLRPDPGSTPLAVSTVTALQYFRSRARAWERQAMIKARQVAGDWSAGAAYLAALEPTVWPIGFNFVAIDETVAMREQIAAVKGAGTVTVPNHNIKVGRGGIREIEFFVQSLQRVAGGRDRRLRGRGTVPMLHALADAHWIEREDAHALTQAYHYLRKVEHRLQMVGDEQVHTLPDSNGLPRIATMMADDEFIARLEATLAFVNETFVKLGNGVLGKTEVAAGMTASDIGEVACAQAFQERLAAWRTGAYQSLKSEQARLLLARLEPSLVAAICSSADPTAALECFDRFLARLQRGVSFLARLDRHRDLIPAFILIITAAPRLAEQLAQRAHLLDVLVDPQFYGRAMDKAALEAAIDQALQTAHDYESALDALRIVGQEQMLLIDVRILTGSVLSAEAGADLSQLAQMLSTRALQLSMDAFKIRHGEVAGGGVALLALGSFGSEEMTTASDLDLVFIYDAQDEQASSDGARALTPGHYYARLAQRFIASMTAPTNHGALYDVDLRLRPSGRAGPLATHIKSFERYHEESAWTWEHMALTRARIAAGDGPLAARAMAAIEKALTRPRDPDMLARDVLDMRRKLDGLSHKDAKHAPGGLVDIEFIAQFLRLRTGYVTTTTSTRRLLQELSGSGALDKGALETLVGAHRLFRKLMLMFAIAGVPAEPESAPAALKPLLLRAADAPDIPFLCADLAARREAVRSLFEAIIGDV